MDIEIEKEIVNKFIHKQYKQRTLYELTSKKKRDITKLRYRFDCRYVIDINEPISSSEDIWRYFQGYGAKKEDLCYVK